MKALPSSASETVAGEQREIVEPPAPQIAAEQDATTSSIDASATGTWIRLIAVKSRCQCCWCAARIGFNWPAE